MSALTSNTPTLRRSAVASAVAAVSLESGLSPVRQPFLYLTAALIAGIIFDKWLEPPKSVAATLAVISIAVSIKLIAARKSLAAASLLLASFACVGALLSAIERADVQGPRLKRLFDERIITPDDPVELTGALLAPPEPAPQAFYLDLEAESVRTGRQQRLATGCARLMIRLADDEAAREFDRLSLDYGSRVRILLRLERARSYSNPGSPDFNDFLERRGCDLKGAIKSPLLIEPLGRAPVNGALRRLYRLRLRLMNAIDARFNARVAGTLKAMLAGNNYFLDPQVSERLRESATFHALVISGFHVSLIAWALLQFPLSVADWKTLRKQTKLKRRGAIRVAAAMFALWAYVLMVGLAPPVLRAAVMITIGLGGPLIFRRSASVNTVSLAAFVMLALKPALTADPGFQLSFVAVAAIVALALPLITALRRIGEWRPVSSEPHPPRCSRAIRSLAETLFWDERGFDREMRRSPIRYRLDKSRGARILSRLRLQRAARAAATLAITSIAIQVCALPLMAFYFNRVSPVGALLNVTAGLLTAIIMLAAVAAIAAAPVSLWAAAKLASIVNAAHYLLANSIQPFAEIPFATFRVAHYEGWHSLIYALYFIPLAALAAQIDRWRPVDYIFPVDRSGEAAIEQCLIERHSEPARAAPLRPRSFVWLRLLALIACMVAVIRPPAVSPNGKLTIHFLDVGQGDSALVIFPRGATMLIDAGGQLRFGGKIENKAREEIEATEPEASEAAQSQRQRSDEAAEPDFSEPDFSEGGFSVGEAVVSRFLWSQGRSRIDYVVATHADQDHIGGFSDVLKNFSVGQAIVGRAPSNDPEFDRFRQAVEANRIALSEVSAGQSFEIEGVRIETLWPPRSSDAAITSGNNDSVALRFVYDRISILLAGDMEREAEEAPVPSGVDLRADVLKVAHHGSKTSSTAAFLDSARPRCAVISVGERSRFGHPHEVVVNRFLERGIRLFQTGRDGMITITTDGSSLDLATYKQ